MKHLILPAVLQLIVLTSTSGVSAADARADQIAVLHDGFGREASAYVDRLVPGLQEDGFSVTRLSAQQVCDKEELADDKFFLYIIPNCRTYPAIGMDAIVNYARNGGHIMFLGGPFLDDPVWLGETGWMDKQLVLAAKRNAPTSNRPFGAPHELNATGWQRTTDDRSNSGSWEIVPEGPQGENCFRYTTERLQGWDGYLSPVVPRLFGQDHDLFVFEAKGATQTTQVAVEIQEQDGSRWIAVAGLTPEWNRIALELRDFKYWPDSQTRGHRGGKGDELNPAEAHRVNFQLAHSHTTAIAPGKHSFWIANVGTAANPVAGMDVATATKGQTLETIFPRYKVHKIGKHTLVQPTNRHELAGLTLTTGDDLVGAIPRTTGCGFQRGQKWRFIPLATASDSAKRSRAYPAWLLLNQSEPLGGSVFACLGWNDTRQLSTPPMLQAVSRTAQRLQLGVFLQEAGSEHFVYWPGEQIRFGATIVNTSKDEHELMVRLTVTDRCDETVLSDLHVVTVPPFESSVWEAKPTLSTESSNDLRVTIELTAADQVIDTIQHDLSVLDTSMPEKDAFIRVEGNNFILHGQRWYPVGINYWPLYVSGMDRGDYWAGWIQRPYYDPDLVEQDLKRMKMLGINMVSIQSNDPQYYRNLLDFIHRCGRHGIYVNLFCGLASPISLREKELRDFIKTARLANNPHIMAYDTIWEPGNYLFRHDWRRRWDPDWRQWIVEQYGDVEWAEQDWQFECPRDDTGRPVAPPDKYFREDGRWRAMMAAYRRFMDDLMSRKWNRANSVLRRLDPNHLVSFRQGNTLPHDFTFTATAKHIDFICPEGYAIPHNEDGYHVAGFITKYVHFTTSGKPIVWSEFGQSVWDPQRMEPSESRIREVSDYHDLFYRMVLETGANGTVPWWWPGGYRVGEHSDYGITDPDGTPRPAAMLISKYSSRLTADRDWPAPTTWYEMDRDKHAGGYWHVCFNAGRDAQRQAVAQGGQLGIRTDGTGTTSADTPMVAVGNRPLNGRNPPKYLNAEFNRLQILDAQGQWVDGLDGARIHVERNRPILARVSVGNTQEATWIAPTTDKLRVGDVVLATTESSQLQGQWPLPRSTSYLKDADFGEIQITRGITSTKLVELRMQAHDRTGFGEKHKVFFLGGEVVDKFQVSVFGGILGALVLIAGTTLSQESPKSGTPPSESEFKDYDQGGIVVDGVAYFTGSDAPGKDHVAAFDLHTLRRLRTYAFAETYDSSPFLFQKKDGTWLIIAHEHKKARTVALNRDTGQVEWISEANQPGTIFFGFSYFDRADGTKLILSPCSNGLHAMDAETGKDVWWVKAGPTGGVTPCVDQEKGWVFYQSSGKVMKIRATDGKVLKSVNVSSPGRCSSWNTVLVNDSHGYFVATRWYGKPEWDSAIRVYDKDLDLVWEKTGLPIGKKSTLTYAEGKLVFGGGNCWVKRPEGDPIDYGYLGHEWKYVAAYEIGTGEIAWKCDLAHHDFTSIMNVPYFNGFFYAETQNGPFASKIFRIAAGNGKLQETLDYRRPITSCGQCIMGHGLILSGDLKEHRLVVTRVAEGSKADWPGPFGDPQTNQMALPDDGNARLVPMKELGRAKREKPDCPKK